MVGWKFYLKTGKGVIESPIIQPLHPRMEQGDGRILKLIAKTCKEIEENDKDIVSWKIKWFNNGCIE